MRIKLFFVVFVFLFISCVYFYVSQFKKPIPLGQIEAQLSSNEVLTEKQLKDIVKNFENRDLYIEDDFNSDNIINEIAFLTSSDSILIREIEKAQSGSHDDRSKFIDKNTTELYYLCLKLLNENIHQQYLKTATLESMEKRNLIIRWIAENLDKLRTSEFLKSQILFYKSMDGKKLRQKLLLEHCINTSRQYLQSNPPKSIFWINKALSYAKNLGDLSAFYILISRIQFLLIEYFGFTNTAVKLGDYYIEQANHIDYDLLIAALYYLNGMARIDKGEYNAAIEDFTTALKIYKTLNHTRMLPAIYGRAGVVYRHLGDYDKAFEQFENVRLYKEPYHEMLYYLETGLLFAETGEFSKADSAYYKSLDLAKELDNISNQVVALTNLSNLYFELGDLQAAFSFNEQALRAAEKAPNPVVLINIWFSLAEFCAINNDFEKAKDYASKATEYLSKHNFGLSNAIGYLTAGKLQLKIGQFQEALASLQSSLAGFNKIQDLTRQIKTLNLIGETYRNL